MEAVIVRKPFELCPDFDLVVNGAWVAAVPKVEIDDHSVQELVGARLSYLTEAEARGTGDLGYLRKERAKLQGWVAK